MTREELIKTVLDREEINVALADTKLSKIVVEALGSQRAILDARLDVVLAGAPKKKAPSARGLTAAIKSLGSGEEVKRSFFKVSDEAFSSAVRRLTRAGVLTFTEEKAYVRV